MEIDVGELFNIPMQTKATPKLLKCQTLQAFRIIMHEELAPPIEAEEILGSVKSSAATHKTPDDFMFGRKMTTPRSLMTPSATCHEVEPTNDHIMQLHLGQTV